MLLADLWTIEPPMVNSLVTCVTRVIQMMPFSCPSCPYRAPVHYELMLKVMWPNSGAASKISISRMDQVVSANPRVTVGFTRVEAGRPSGKLGPDFHGHIWRKLGSA